MIILIDQDGPLADFESGFLIQWRKKFPRAPYIPLHLRKSPKIYDDYPPELKQDIESIYRTAGFYKNLTPVAGSLEAIRELVKISHEIFICTAPLDKYQHCVAEKYEWVEKHLGLEFTKKVILTKDKTLIQGDILIDDQPKIDGLLKPKWEHVLIDAPYNQTAKHKRRLASDWHNWRKIIEP